MCERRRRTVLRDETGIPRYRPTRLRPSPAPARPGAPSRPLEARLANVAGAPLGWSLGWFAWMLAALAFLAFVVVLARRTKTGRFAVPLAGIAVAIDLLCDGLQIAVLPLAAREGRAAFELVERALWTGGVVVTLGLPRRKETDATAAGVLLGGAVWTACDLAGARYDEACTALTVRSFVAWALFVPRTGNPS